ncbi:carbonic anhydrase XVa [Pimephales promelas]|nr:carbonic anhydrase XVa [Pimephales promelas]
MIVFLVISLAALLCPSVHSEESSEKWCYHKPSCNFSTWPQTYPQSCNGSRQSPINIVTASVQENPSLSSFNFTGFDDNSTFKSITNTGKSVVVGLDDHKIVSARSSSPGSEHTVDGKRYSMELHIVNVHSKYNGSVDAALAAKQHRSGCSLVSLLRTFSVSLTSADSESLHGLPAQPENLHATSTIKPATRSVYGRLGLVASVADSPLKSVRRVRTVVPGPAELPGPGHVLTELPGSRHVSAELPEPHHISHAKPQTVYIMTAEPETLPRYPAEPELHVSPAEPETVHVTSAPSETVHVTPAESETVHVTSALSETVHVTPAESETVHVTPAEDCSRHFCLSETVHVTSADPETIHVTSTDPVSPDKMVKPVSPDKMAEPVSPDKMAEPVSLDKMAEPVSPDKMATAEPVSPDMMATAEPMSPDKMATVPLCVCLP